MMLATHLATLTDADSAGLADTLDVVAGVDAALVGGLARVGVADAAALAALAGALAATPLGDPVADAVAAITSGSVTQQHLTLLAAGRAALLGAAHDALLGQLDTALGRLRTPWPPAPAAQLGTMSPALTDARAQLHEPAQPATAAPALAGARAWLHELAVTGWRGVDHELVAAAGTPVEAALAVPALRRLAVLLDGFAAELRAGVPVAAMPQLPVRRWADLWTRAMLLAQDAYPDDGAGAEERVSGRLSPLGVDVHEHDTAVQVQLHAILEPADGGPPRLVRTCVGAAKVDTIVGPAVWRLLGAYPVLLAALAQQRGLTVTDLPAHGAELRWHDDRAQLDEPVNPFTAARVLLPTATAMAVAPLDRHPAVLAEPVLVEGQARHDDSDGLGWDMDGQRITLAVDRLPSCGPLTPALVAAAWSCIGLLRWDDGRWSLQPLAIWGTVKRTPFAAYTGQWAAGVTDPKVAKAQARAGDSVAVLTERAGRLLRR